MMQIKTYKNLNFKKLEIVETYYLEQGIENLVEEKDMKREIGESSNMPILEPIIELSNIENYLNKRGVLDSKEEYTKAERVFRVNTKKRHINTKIRRIQTR